MVKCIGMTLLLFVQALFTLGQQQEGGRARPGEKVILQREDSTNKMIIIIDGDKVTINGKSPEEMGEGDVIIRRRKPGSRVSPEFFGRSPRVFVMPDQNFRIERDFRWDKEDGDMQPSNPPAMLGVNYEKSEKGIRIISVVPGSAAEKAGLQQDDIITRMNGDTTSDVLVFRNRVREKKPGDEVEIHYLRSGEKKEKKVMVKLGAMMPEKILQLPLEDEGEVLEGLREMPEILGDVFGREFGYMGKRPQLGIRIQDTENAAGVEVLEVNPGSPAEKSGLKPKDIITRIDEKEIKDTDEARENMQKVRDKAEYNLRINRDGKTLDLKVAMPRKLKMAEL